MRMQRADIAVAARLVEPVPEAVARVERRRLERPIDRDDDVRLAVAVGPYDGRARPHGYCAGAKGEVLDGDRQLLLIRLSRGRQKAAAQQEDRRCAQRASQESAPPHQPATL